ncbi:hypothetical protein DF186_24215, partial [Enterococcus hirae]
QARRLDDLDGMQLVTTSDGRLNLPAEIAPVTLVQAIVGPEERTTAMVRFGGSVAGLLRTGRFRTVLLSGGETAQTVLR